MTLLGPDGHAVVVEAVVTAGAGGEPLLSRHLAEADGTEGVVVAVVIVLLLHRRARGGGGVVVVILYKDTGMRFFPGFALNIFLAGLRLVDL